MKRALMTLGLVLAVGNVAGAQEPVVKGSATEVVTARSESVAPANALSTNGTEMDGAPVADTNAPGIPSAPEPAPTPKNIIFGERDDYRWQLGIGVEVFRFQSSIINATMVGTNTTLSYYTNSWFAVEGSLITGFAPTIYQQEHVKMFGGGGGLRVGGRRAKFEPFGHAMVGGNHMVPQTAGNSKTALMAQAGIGLDYRVHARLSFRVQGDWVYTGYYGQTQNNFQAVGGLVLHF